MSATSQQNQSWVKSNYEKVILVGTLVILLLSAVILVWKVSLGNELLQQSGRDPRARADQVLAALSAAELEKNAVAPAVVSLTTGSNRLFTSELRLWCVKCLKPIPYAAAKCPFCGEEQPSPEKETTQSLDSDSDLIPDEFEKKYNLNPFDASDALIDTDRDGFTNLEEYNEKTSIIDPKDFPPPAMKLRVANIKREPFKFRFLGYSKMSETITKYQINLRAMDRTYFAAVGEKIKVKEKDKEYEYQIEKFEKDPKTGKEQLFIRQGEKQIKLIKNEVYIEESLAAQLIDLVDPKNRPVGRIGDTFDLKGSTYRIEAIMSNVVRVLDTKTNREFVLTYPTAEERMMLTSGMSAGAGPSPMGPAPMGPAPLNAPGAPMNIPPGTMPPVPGSPIRPLDAGPTPPPGGR